MTTVCRVFHPPNKSSTSKSAKTKYIEKEISIRLYTGKLRIYKFIPRSNNPLRDYKPKETNPLKALGVVCVVVGASRATDTSSWAGVSNSSTLCPVSSGASASASTG